MHIPPPIPAPDIPLEVERNLQEVANGIASAASYLVRDVFGEDSYVDREELDDWLGNQHGIRQLAAELGYPFLGSGADRLVFDVGDFVAKLELFGTESSEHEWRTWHHLRPERRLWLARPYALSKDGTVVVMEKLAPYGTVSEYGTASEVFRMLVSQILEQEPWMVDFVVDPSWYNWGYRTDSETPVVLDYGL